VFADFDWIHLVSYRQKWRDDVNTVTNFVNFYNSLATISFSIKTLLHGVNQPAFSTLWVDWFGSRSAPNSVPYSIKGNVISVPKHQAMKAYWGLEMKLHAFLTSALDGVECSASFWPLYLRRRIHKYSLNKNPDDVASAWTRTLVVQFL
jgi:hypothetical protein